MRLDGRNLPFSCSFHSQFHKSLRRLLWQTDIFILWTVMFCSFRLKGKPNMEPFCYRLRFMSGFHFRFARIVATVGWNAVTHSSWLSHQLSSLSWFFNNAQTSNRTREPHSPIPHILKQCWRWILGLYVSLPTRFPRPSNIYNTVRFGCLWYWEHHFSVSRIKTSISFWP